MSANLVIGAYNYENPLKKNGRCGIDLFINTLRKNNKDCKVIVISHKDNKNWEFDDILKKKDVYVEYRDFDPNKLVTQERFYIIQDILENNTRFENILISDMNDVMFLDDPFSINFEDKIYCACEASTISDDGYCGKVNRKWIERYYKKKKRVKGRELRHTVLKKYYNKKILCAGTILGNRSNILDFLKYLKKENEGKYKFNDQGLYNIYCYNNQEKCKMLEYSRSKILTCGDINYKLIKKNPSGELINTNGEKYSILHQVDRWGEEIIIDLAKG